VREMRITSKYELLYRTIMRCCIEV